MQSIQTNDSFIHFNEMCYEALDSYLNESTFSLIFILVDENTKEYCLQKFLKKIELHTPVQILEIKSGEIHKTIQTCTTLWRALSEKNADRKSLLINLGGGVITDLGGFVASTFKRGIRYINVPTTLLAMVDASVGGKTGVDLDNIKNQVGIINSGDMVLIDTTFLSTLPKNQIRSGMAEMLKHGLIHGHDYWGKMINYSETNESNLDSLIYGSVLIKNEVVTLDPNENDLRKTLNFGHTLGHAIESYFLEHPKKQELLHGEAIAIGMILECFISNRLLNFPKKALDQLVHLVKSLYRPAIIVKDDYAQIIELLKFDKKNDHGNINFVLLNDIGSHKIDCKVENVLINEAFKYYSLQMKTI